MIEIYSEFLGGKKHNIRVPTGSVSPEVSFLGLCVVNFSFSPYMTSLSAEAPSHIFFVLGGHKFYWIRPHPKTFFKTSCPFKGSISKNSHIKRTSSYEFWEDTTLSKQCPYDSNKPWWWSFMPNILYSVKLKWTYLILTVDMWKRDYPLEILNPNLS